MSPRLVAVLCLVSVPIPCPRTAAQDRRQQPPPTSVRKDYAELIHRLTHHDTVNDKPPGIRERVRMLRAFVHRHAPATGQGKRPVDTNAHVRVLKARSRLGRLLLVSFASSDAIQELQNVIELARAPEHRDLRGRALYGIAQAQEMLGQVQACRTTLRQLQDEFEDTRYGRIAAIAARRLSKPSGRARNGVVAPPFAPLLDLDGRLVSHVSLRLKPALLMFWSPDVDSSVKRVQRLAGAWKEAGGDPRQVVAFAVHPDRSRVAAVVKQAEWSVSVVPCCSDFLDPVVLAYGVDGVPTTFLLGPDGMLLGRDQGAQEIVHLLEKLR